MAERASPWQAVGGDASGADTLRTPSTVIANGTNGSHQMIAKRLSCFAVATTLFCWALEPSIAQTEQPNLNDACQERIAAVRDELYRRDEIQTMGDGDEENRDSPLGMINSMVRDAQSALDKGNEERCKSLVTDAEKALKAL